MRRDLFYTLLAVAVLAIAAIPVGSAVFVLGFVHGDSPCVLCWAQRTAMVLVALMGLFVLRYGPRPRYLGLSVLIAGWGIYMGFRHSAAHVVRDVGQGFSAELFGAHTYVWSMFIFWATVMAMGLLLMLLREGAAARDEQRRPGLLTHAAMWTFLVVVAGNIVQAFATTGPPPFMGQADPVRFSWNPKHWVWSLEEWHPAPITWRGRWDIDRPAVTGLDINPAAGPLAALPLVQAQSRGTLALPVDGPLTGLAHEAERDRFALATAHGVYLTDGALSRVERGTVVDPGFSVDLGTFGGVAFLAPDTVLALSQNKSYVVLQEAEPPADAVKNFRFFLSSPTAFHERARGRFATIRAKMMFVDAVAVDRAAGAIYTVSVPHRHARTLVLSRFDRRDMTLSAESVVRLGAPAPLAPAGEQRGLHEYHVSGLAFADGRLFAVSAAYSTLLVIDAASGLVTSAVGINGVDRPIGLAVRGDELLLVNAAGQMATIRRPDRP
jgi:disulfide bond formation protein DsbB